MFDLEKAVGEWRTAQASLPASVLTELEEHLRTSTEALAANGLSDEEAFLIARRRLGSPAQLDGEFEKVPGACAERRVRWLTAGVIAALFVPGAMRIASQGGALAAVGLGVPERALPWIVVGAGALLFVWAWRRVATLSGGAREGLVAFVEGDPAARSNRLKTGSLIVGAFVGVLALKMTVSIGMAQVAPASAMGYAAIGSTILGFFSSLALLVGAVFLLARGRPATA